MKQGVYKIYGLHEDAQGNEQRSYYGRLAVVAGQTQVLEDHQDGFLYQLFPDGTVDALKQQRFAGLQESPYYDVVPEGLVDAGAPQPMPQPVAQPDELFTVIDAQGQQQRLEVFGEDVFLDGKHMSPADIETLQRRVAAKEVHLRPEHL